MWYISAPLTLVMTGIALAYRWWAVAERKPVEPHMVAPDKSDDSEIDGSHNTVDSNVDKPTDMKYLARNSTEASQSPSSDYHLELRPVIRPSLLARSRSG
ncbi:hypothetical protein VTJ04DRAFT_2781 [Mycothermus thermophilus]|uniref:uncharacterized protein n=1 Tax=Humicola insolens TaxID=85995 RepID=UPI0037423883